MLLPNTAIAIIGGGPGGLTLARLLQLKGFTNIKIYERDVDENARVQGAPLDLHDDSGLMALNEAQLMDAFKQNYMPGADRLKIMNEAGEIFYNDHEKFTGEAFGNNSFRPEIDRGVLRKMLLQSLLPGTVIWNTHYSGLEKSGSGWMLQFKNSAPAYADLVIAADGANSKVRPYVTGATPVYSGISMLEGTIYKASQNAPAINAVLQGGKIMAFGNEQLIIIGQKANDEIGFYLSFAAAENWNTANGIDYENRGQLLSWFKSTYSEWADMWSELLRTCHLPITPRAISYLPQQAWQTQPNITLLGDAAHLMPPFAGEGVNMAMLDAVKLCDALTATHFNNTEEAIYFYENELRSRAAAAIEDSLSNGVVMHSPSALHQMLQLFNGH